ncbi:hypothetical protein HZS_346 [Henneguya salminicola]|nr:hypothetical protein HZS_346 [Henneguya salminicola]
MTIYIKQWFYVLINSRIFLIQEKFLHHREKAPVEGYSKIKNVSKITFSGDNQDSITGEEIIDDTEQQNLIDEQSDTEEDIGKTSKRQQKKLRRLEKNKQKYASKQIDPNKQHSELVEEYYNLDYEDIIDDMPVRYNYRTVIPNSYGLTPEEVL